MARSFVAITQNTASSEHKSDRIQGVWALGAGWVLVLVCLKIGVSGDRDWRFNQDTAAVPHQGCVTKTGLIRQNNRGYFQATIPQA